MSRPFSKLIAPLAAATSVGAMAVGVFVYGPAPSWGAEHCSVGETLDPSTDICMPALPADVVELTTPVEGGLPEVNGVPCTGSNTNECIGLGEEDLASGPTPSASSTVTADADGAPPSTVVAVTPNP